MMRIRYVLAVSMWLKVGLVLLCLSMLYVNRLWSESYFSATATPAEQRQLVIEAQNRDQVNDLGLTGLMFAAIYGQLGLAKALFEYGADLNIKSQKEQQTALHNATNNLRAEGSRDVGYFLIDAYANTMIKNIFGQIPLHLVVSTDVIDDRTKMVEYLMKNGSDINTQTGQGDTLIHLAVNMRDVGWLETLLRQWASLINLSIENKKGWTPYEYAVELGFEPLAELFHKEYPKVTKAADRDSNGLTGLMLAIMKKDQSAVDAMAKEKQAINLTSQDRYSNSALHVALVQQNVPAVASLVANGADVMIKNAQGEVPAHYLVRVWDVTKKLKVAQTILSKNAQAIVAKNNNGNTLVHYVVQYNDIPLLKYLIDNYKTRVQEALDIKNQGLESPRELATRLHHIDISRTLDSVSTLRGKSSKQAYLHGSPFQNHYKKLI